MQEAIISQAKDEIKQKIYNLFTWTKEQNIDIFDTASTAYKTNITKWKQYVEGLENKEDYLQNFDLDVVVSFNMIR